MDRLIKLTFILLFFAYQTHAQGYVTMVVDYRLGAAIATNNVATMSALKPMREDTDDIKEYQQNIAIKTGIIHEVKDRMYQSKFNVAEEVKSGQNVISAAKLVKDIGDYQLQMVNYSKENPALLVVAYKAQSALIDRTANLMTYIYQNALKGGDENLISSKQRLELIRHVIKELRVIRGIAYGVNRRMRFAARVGVVKAVNPFGIAYPNRDVQIIKDILNDF
ncbi:MAG: hypothetical protein CMO01_04100 [Thalassobius sp.]|nr:hypothetical protein [Thalassovita sp.]